MRLLHIRANHVGGCAVERTLWARGRGSEGVHERKYLSLRSLSQHCRCYSECSAKRQATKRRMKTFALTRASDSAQAIATAAKANTAQHGAYIRFIGGVDTLYRVNNLKIDQARSLIDIN